MYVCIWKLKHSFTNPWESYEDDDDDDRIALIFDKHAFLLPIFLYCSTHLNAYYQIVKQNLDYKEECDDYKLHYSPYKNKENIQNCATTKISN